MASDNEPAVTFLTEIVAEPAPGKAFTLYAPLVPPEVCWSSIKSVAVITELVKTKDTVVLAANAAAFIVI